MAPKGKILIVDDEPKNLKLLAAALSLEQYHTIAAAGGSEALERMEGDLPDLVVLDIVMPGMSGFDVCRAIKANPAWRGIPVLFITAMDDPRHKSKGFKVGAVDYITKPFDLGEVKARIRTHLSLRAAQNALESQNLLLEERVRARTLELTRANAALQQEVVERKRAGEELRASEARSRAILDAMPDTVFQIHRGGTLQEVRNRGSVLPEEGSAASGKNIREVLPAQQAEQLLRHVENTLDRGGIAIFEQSVPRNGAPRFLEFRMVAFAEQEVLTIVRDVTGRRLAEDALRHSEEMLRQENLLLKSSIKERYKFGDIVGKSPPMQRIYNIILKAVEVDASVVIYGESGTGKELVARAIHDMSDRRMHRFVPVNSGAIPENLLESEFFGYRKGAFTGAETDKDGYLDMAHNGTLFLDEIGELPLNLQVKLLRAVEGGGYTPIGGDRVKKSNVRFITATNRDLADMMKKGLMREDFYYRIHIISIDLPPLRERKEDLPLLIDHFLNLYSDKGMAVPPISGKQFEVLYNHKWPGNVRELQNTLYRYITLGKLDIMDAARSGPVRPDPAPPEAPVPDDPDLDFKSIMQRYEKRLIVRALEANHWHKEKTAAHLGIPRRTFFRKLKAMEL